MEDEALLSQAAPREVATMLICAGKELTQGPLYSPLSDWKQRELFRSNQVNRFWFEDARWREKFAYHEFRERRRKEIA